MLIVEDRSYSFVCFSSRINVTVLDFVKNLPQFNRSDYQSARLPFDLFRPYAYLLEEKYRGRTGNENLVRMNCID